MIKGYKFIKKNKYSHNGKKRKWIKNHRKQHEGTIKPCKQGFHACKEPIQTLDFIYGSVFCIVEAKGEIIHDNNKFVARSMRVTHFFSEEETKIIFLEFAIKTSWHVLKHYENKYPNDKRVRQAIQSTKKVLKNPNEKNRKAAYEAYAAAKTAANAANAPAKAAAKAAASTAYAAYAAAYAPANAAYAASKTVYEAAKAAAYAAENAAYAPAKTAANTTYAAYQAAYAAANAQEEEQKWQNNTIKKIIKKNIKKKTGD